MSRLLVFSLVFLFSLSSWARDLTNKELFFRCYQHLTQKFPAKNNPARIAVEVNNKNAVTACMEDVFDQALLVNDQVTDSLNQTTLDVINNFQNLHASWFRYKDTNQMTVSGYTHEFPKDIYETSGPANYITRAMFDEALPASYIFTADHHLDSVRNLGRKPITSTNSYARGFIENVADVYFSDFSMMYDIGKVIGFKPRTISSEIVFPYTFQNKAYGGAVVTRSGGIPLKAHYGGGVLGSIPYITQSIDEDYTFKIDGGVEIPRKWGESLVNDFLCRELPVVRESDVTQYVNINSELPYRKQSSCTACHATMDQITGVIRGYSIFENRHYRYNAVTDSNDLRGGVYEFNLKYHPKDPRIGSQHAIRDEFPPPEPSLAGWPDYQDADYQKRPATGKLFYRDSNGNLVDQSVSGLEDLGAKLSSQIDPYLCLTKRYYHYFMGVDVPLGDPGVATYGVAPDNTHKQKVFSLAQGLSGNPIGTGSQSLRSLIHSIISSPEYKKSNFGVSNE